MKILIVHNYYQIPGGEDMVVANEKRMLEENGNRVIVYSRNNDELKRMGIMRKFLLPFASIFNIRTFMDICKIIKNEKIDVVHVHNTVHLISVAVYYASVFCHTPIVQTIHNFRLLCPGATFYRDGKICEDCVKKGLRCAIKHSCYRESRIQTMMCTLSMCIHRMIGIYGKINYICLTDFNKKKLLELRQIKAENVFVKPNYVPETNDYILEENREDRYIFAGRLDKLKGIDVLLRSWKKLGDKAPMLVVCGTGPMEEWCKNYVSENGLNVELKGFVPNEEVKKLISESKALILPTQLYEGFPMGIVEAYSVGTPVICSNIGNAGAIVTENITGAKFDPNDEMGLIAALERSAGLCASVKAEYNKKYNQVRNYERLIEIYSSLSKCV